MDRAALIGHLPIDRVHSLAAMRPLPIRCNGAAVFADLGGFTAATKALTDQLGRRRGAEVLTRHLNTVYDAIIGPVHDNGGAVVDFSGDAITCWFDDLHLADDHRGSLRAVSACADMHRAMRQVEQLAIGEQLLRVSLKAGLAAGAAIRWSVGDPDVRVLDVLAGPTVMRAADAERAAGPGETLVDAAIRSEVAERVHLTARGRAPGGTPVWAVTEVHRPARPSPWPVLPTTAPDRAELELWIDHRIRPHATEPLPELRSNVAMFVGLAGFEPDDDDEALAALEELVLWAQSIVTSHGGTLLQVNLAEKGGYLYVSFGAPVAHEDLADRAIACALDLRHPPAGSWHPMDGSVGVDLTTARAGAYGSADRRTYGVIGDGTNTAAHLMAAASGEILVTRRLLRALRRRVRSSRGPEFRTKGGTVPVDVWIVHGYPVIGHEGRVFGRALVSRQTEVAQVLAALEPLHRGETPGTVIIQGGPGVGKSHLVEIARSELGRHVEVTWLLAAATEGSATAFHVFLPMLRDAFYQELGPDPAARRALFELGITSVCEQLATHESGAELAGLLRDADSHLAALIGIRWAGSIHERLEPGARIRAQASAIATLLRAQNKLRPLVVHIRDIQWADDASRLAIAMLGTPSDHGALALVVERRGHGDPAADLGWVAGAGAGAGATVVELDDLDGDGVDEMVTALVGGPCEPGLVARIRARTRGNPLFLELLVADLVDRGILQDTPHGWRLPEGSDDDVPVSLVGVLASRMDRLPAATVAAVRAAAVLGDRFELAEVASLTGLEVISPEVSGPAADAGLWVLQDDRGAFRHALVREAAYQIQLEEQLRELHRRAAITTARAAGDVVKWADVARHLRCGGLPLRSAAAYRRAGMDAESRSSFGEARLHYEAALAVVIEVGCRAGTTGRLRDDAARVSQIVGDYAACTAHLRVAIDQERDGDPSIALQRHIRLGEAFERWGRLDDAESALESALVCLQSSPDFGEASRIYSGLALLHGRRGDLDAGIELGEMALRFADEPWARARALQCLGSLQWRRGDPIRACDHGEEALALARDAGDLHRQAAIANNLGLAYAALDQPIAAIASFESALEVFEAIGNDHGTAGVLDNLAATRVANGDEEGGMADLVRAVEILARIGLTADDIDAALWQGGAW